MTNTLRVQAIKEAKDAHHPDPLSTVLPTHEFSLTIIAPRGSGKTTLILNMLSNFYKGYFHSIKTFSPTMSGDAKWETIRKMTGVLSENKHLKELENAKGKRKTTAAEESDDSDTDSEQHKGRGDGGYNYYNSWHNLFASNKPPAVAVGNLESHPSSMSQAIANARGRSGKTKKKFTGRIPHKDFYTNYDEDDLQNIMTDTMSQIKQFKRLGKTKHHANRQLLIFDDLVGSNLFSAKKENPFRRLNTTLRHYSTSAIMVTQAYKEIPKTVRVNSSSLVLFEIANQHELETIYEENNCGLTKDEWLKVYHYCTDAPYSFMFINYQKQKNERISRNFEEYIPIKPQEVDTHFLLKAEENSKRTKLFSHADNEENDDDGKKPYSH